MRRERFALHDGTVNLALENKLELQSSADLAREEERISKNKALELFETGTLDCLTAGKFSSLSHSQILFR